MTKEEEALANTTDQSFSKDKVTKTINNAIDTHDLEALKTIISKTHYADLADYLNFATYEQRHIIIKLLDKDIDPLILLEFDPEVLKPLVEIFGINRFATMARKLENDEVVSVLDNLSYEMQKEILSSFPQVKKRLILKALSYPKNSAGMIMQTAYVSIEDNKTIGDAIDYIVGNENLTENCEDIFVTNKSQKPIGIIHISKLLRHKRNVKIKKIMDKEIQTIDAFLDKEDVAYKFKHYDLSSAPVINKRNKIVGIITIDQILDVIEEEAEEDLMRLGGVRISDLYSALLKTTSQRFPWLFFNLLTACMISFVISKFQHQIEQLAILAAIMPIVASMGGNAGTQSVTILIRAIVNKEVTSYNTVQIVFKEIGSCALNGLVLGLLGGTILFFLYKSSALCIIFALAVLINFTLAGLWGTFVPLTLSKIGLDPALASGVFVTFLTDLLGFFIFLTLASLLIL